MGHCAAARNKMFTHIDTPVVDTSSDSAAANARPRRNLSPGNRCMPKYSTSALGGRLASQELSVHGDDHGRDRHEYCAKRRRKQNACCSIEHAGREWEGHGVISRGPPQILYDLAIRRA